VIRLGETEPKRPRWWAAFDPIWAVIVTSLLFWLVSLPVITLPIAWSGAMAAAGALFRPVAGDTVAVFWRTLKRTWGRSLALGLLDLVLGVIIYLDVRLLLGLGTGTGLVLGYIFLLIGLLVAMVNVFAWPLLAWFRKPLIQGLWLALQLVAVHPIQAIGALVAAGSFFYVVLIAPAFLQGLLLAVSPGVMALAVAGAVWKVLQLYPLPEADPGE
jgi:uncharacterized membrane protein YesL